MYVWTGEIDFLLHGSSLAVFCKIRGKWFEGNRNHGKLFAFGTTQVTQHHWKSFSAEISSELGTDRASCLITCGIITSVRFQILVEGGNVAFMYANLNRWICGSQCGLVFVLKSRWLGWLYIIIQFGVFELGGKNCAYSVAFPAILMGPMVSMVRICLSVLYGVGLLPQGPLEGSCTVHMWSTSWGPPKIMLGIIQSPNLLF